MTWLWRLVLVVLLAALSVAYLWPAFDPVLQGDVQQALSDGTDATTLPYQYSVILDLWRSQPSELFYGAVPAAHLQAPGGLALWIPWIEKWTVVGLAPFVPVEHISTFFVALLFGLNALAMYALGRTLGWSREISLAFGLAWAFCPFTRGRAQVHAALVGTYLVPLFMWAVMLVLQGREKWRVLLAAVALLLVGSAAHYFVITLTFLSPGLLILAFVMTEKKVSGAWARLVLAMLPLIFFLGWCYSHPLPEKYIQAGAIAQPPSGKTADGRYHPFLFRFAAHPIDYFTGDLALGSKDIIPWRADLSSGILSHLGDSIAHERANGVRWSIWLMALASLLCLSVWRTNIVLVTFGLAAFWLSLSPEGPSAWLYSLVSQIRVPARAGIFVHFSLLLLAGRFAARQIPPYLQWILPLLILAELPFGFQPMSVKEVRKPLQGFSAPCRAGLYLPYVSGNHRILDDYYFLQEMRGSDCAIVNVQWPNNLNTKLLRAMALTPENLEAFNRMDPIQFAAIEKFVPCARLSWIVFDPRTDFVARASLCRSLRWVMTADRICQNLNPPQAPPPQNMEGCF